MRTKVERAVEARLLPDPNAALHLGQDRTADRTVRADRFFDFDRTTAGRCGLSFGHHTTAHAAQGSETANSQSRIAQEGAPINSASGQLV